MGKRIVSLAMRGSLVCSKYPGLHAQGKAPKGFSSRKLSSCSPLYPRNRESKVARLTPGAERKHCSAGRGTGGRSTTERSGTTYRLVAEALQPVEVCVPLGADVRAGAVADLEKAGEMEATQPVVAKWVWELP